jgi:arsenate reductase
MLKLYLYKGCDTCRKARKDLDANGVAYTEIAIRETPPTLNELQQMLAAYDGNIKKLFNTSGADYRSMKIGERLPTMSTEEALALLASNGNLVKRPFIIDPAQKIFRVGYTPS